VNVSGPEGTSLFTQIELTVVKPCAARWLVYIDYMKLVLRLAWNIDHAQVMLLRSSNLDLEDIARKALVGGLKVDFCGWNTHAFGGLIVRLATEKRRRSLQKATYLVEDLLEPT